MNSLSPYSENPFVRHSGGHSFLPHSVPCTVRHGVPSLCLHSENPFVLRGSRPVGVLSR
jgi:hypothetical protein